MSNIKAPLITTTWTLSSAEYGAALLSFVGVEVVGNSSGVECSPSPTSNLEYLLRLVETSENHKQRMLNEQKKSHAEARQIEWNDMRVEVLRLFKAAIDNIVCEAATDSSVCVNVDERWLKNARSIYEQFK